MTASSITPLRKKKDAKEVYTRLPEIEAKLVEISKLTRDEISALCAIRDTEDPKYLPSECLVYLVREHRTRPMDACSEVLYKTLLDRLWRGLPNGESLDGERVNASETSVAEKGRHRFIQMLVKDRSDYVEGLDIYEVRFAKALKTLRIDSQRWAARREKPLESITIDQETGEISEEVERAAGSFEPFDAGRIDDNFYLSRLNQAIDALPELQKAIIEMDRKEIPTESKEPGIVNISTLLGKTPKTIRTHRALAYATLRAELTKGETR